MTDTSVAASPGYYTSQVSIKYPHHNEKIKVFSLCFPCTFPFQHPAPHLPLAMPSDSTFPPALPPAVTSDSVAASYYSNHGNIKVGSHHIGICDMCVYLVHILQPPLLSTPATGPITDPQHCM